MFIGPIRKRAVCEDVRAEGANPVLPGIHPGGSGRLGLGERGLAGLMRDERRIGTGADAG
jgi:hypothetical protein